MKHGAISPTTFTQLHANPRKRREAGKKQDSGV